MDSQSENKSTNILNWANETGEFIRKVSQFRSFVSKDSRDFPPESGRYHLYVSLACPWAHRTLIVRALKGLEDVISVTVVHYLMGDKGWEFKGPEVEGCNSDPIYDAQYLREIYFKSDPDYNGRFTVPVLFDKKTRQIVSNESSEIIRMLNSEFNEFSKNPELDLYPESLRSKIDEINQIIYNGINNGVYKAGFATLQKAYEENAKLVYETLVEVEKILSENNYICGESLTEADIRHWTSVIRHDPVYHGHFKCNLISIRELPSTLEWMRKIYLLPGVKETVNMNHIKRHYYMSHTNINPTQVVPLSDGPLKLF